MFKAENLISPFILLSLLAIVICISLFGALYYHPLHYTETRLSVFITILAGFALSFIGLGIVVTSLTYRKTLEVTTANMTKSAINTQWIEPNKLLTTTPHLRPAFIKSLYYNNLDLFNSSEESQNVGYASVIQEQYISIVLIQAWEDFLTMRNFDKTGDRVWLTNFIQWAQSPYLKKNFDFLKYNFKNPTILLGELLFDYAKKLPIPTTNPDSYEQIVGNVLNDDRLSQIFKLTNVR